MAPLIKITADEVNQIIYSYLQDSGFQHTAFALRAEGRLEEYRHFNEYVPRGELVELLTKALLYIEVETHCKGDGLITDCKAPFSLLKPHECAVDLMEDGVNGTTDKVARLSVSNGVLPDLPTEPQLKRKATIPAEGDNQDRRIKRSLEPESVGDTNTRNTPASVPDERMSSERDASPMPIVPNSNGGLAGGKQKTTGPGDDRTPAKAIYTLPGHEQEVFVAAWNPVKAQIVATGSKDATVRIYELPDPPDDPSQFAEPPEKPPIIVRHKPDTEQTDITALDWNPDGTLLVTGSFDSVLRIWTVAGTFYMSHPQHQGPIFSTRFSKSGKWVLSCSLDGTACVWDVAGKKLHMQFRCHRDCCLDAVWLDEETFATCGADKTVNIMRVGEQDPVYEFYGHESEINAIRLNPSGTRLASCSDDRTVRIWETPAALASPGQVGKVNVTILGSHTDSIANLSWCPKRPDGTHEIIATVCFDGSSCLWDASTGKCLHAFHDHKKACYSLTFSPDGKFFATGSGDGCLFVYSVETGKRVWSWFGGSDKSGIYDIAWQQSGKLNRIALCMESCSLIVVDVTRVPALMEAK